MEWVLAWMRKAERSDAMSKIVTALTTAELLQLRVGRFG